MYSQALQAYNSNTYVVRSYSLATGPCMHVRMAGFKLCTKFGDQNAMNGKSPWVIAATLTLT